ncbi:MAG: NADP-dependent isocitrate dehydrogenase [Magnetococcales bacterium]|nr:NADP-dependent isocitrate dehydrogenase [Magnetococcales bacterium]
MSNDLPDIIYTKVDEAPELASGSFLPIIQAFTRPAGVSVGTKDISLAGRILANFPEYLTEAQRQPDDLAELGELVTKPEANVIKLPNVSASQPQLDAAIKELQSQGYNLPLYPVDPQNDAEREAKTRYDKIKGSAVNPVLREGNSDRRAPLAVKEFAKKNPHSMGKWSPDSKSHVSTMSRGDFFANEQSAAISAANAGEGRIEFVDAAGAVSVLKKLPFKDGEVVDATFMSVKALRAFYKEQIADAKAKGVLFSLHLKATMMKVSDPIMFGHAVSIYFEEVFAKHGATLAAAGVDPNNGLGDLYAKIASLPEKEAIEADIKACMEKQATLYMVNSDRGITNLHVPSDVIIDASMPAMIRAGGIGWGPDGKACDAKAVIPDHSYSGVYDAVIRDCIQNGALDPSKMGTVPNVGLMAQKAEEYGSHPTTFKAAGDGVIRVIDGSGAVLHQHTVEAGDIWRLCSVKDAPIQDWVKLAVTRARLSNTPAVFWLDKNRPHDAQLIAKVERYLKNHDTTGLDLQIMSPQDACAHSLKRIRQGLDTISCTGNVLRDYLTDLFPILEVGTSAKMLSIVPLMNGGGLFETGAGGSAPKHVQQLQEEGFLRWDSLGEFCALAASFEHLSVTRNNPKAAVLAKTLDLGIGKLLDNNKGAGRKLGDLDNRGSHFYLAMYWAQALAEQNDDAELKAHFAPIAQKLADNEASIVAELAAAQGQPADTGGYYHGSAAKVAAVMRPSPTLNAIIG